MESKKQILIIAETLDIGGIEKSLINMLNSFDYEKYEVDLRLYENSGALIGEINKNVNILEEDVNLKVFFMSIKELFKNRKYKFIWIKVITKFYGVYLSYIKGIKESAYMKCQFMNNLYSKSYKEIYKKKYDVGISYIWPINYLLYNVDADKKIGWIHTDYSKIPLDKKRDLELWGSLNNIMAVSDECRNAFLKSYQLLEKKVLVMENIMDIVGIREKSIIQEELFDKDYFNIVSVGRLCNAKGFDNAILVLKKLHEIGYKNIRWHVVGFGSDNDKLKKIINEAYLEDSFILLGEKTNPYPYMKQADLYAQPSRYEGKAVTVSEAKILGKATIIANYETAKSQVTHMIDGYISEGDIESLVKSIELLYKDEELRKSLEKNCSKTNYENKKEIEKLYEII